MKNKTLKKTAFLSLLSTGMMLAGLGVPSATPHAKSESPFRDQYVVNEEISVPDLELQVDGVAVKADKYVIYPNGRVYQKDSFVPTEMGAYKVRYTAKGQVKEFDFYVAGEKYKMEGDGSSTYGAHQKTPSKEALIVSFAAGGVFHFDEIINIKELGPKKSLFSFYPVSSTTGLLDATTLKVRFTDVYDETKYLQYEIDATREGYAHGVSYVRVGGENQTPTGLEASHNKVHVGNIWGFPYPCNFYCSTKSMAAYQEAQYIENRMSLYFDYDSKQALTMPNNNGETMICDLDSSKYYENAWSGFTTGECKVSAWFEGFQAPEATLCITGIGDASLSDPLLKDTIAPKMEIKDVFSELPDAIIGQKYRFYQADSVDQYAGKLDTSIRVYRDYYTANKQEVPCFEDGFIPTRLGTYYIEYVAKDHSGNTVKKLYEISCVNEKRSFGIELEPGYATKGFVGSPVKVAKASAKGATGSVASNITLIDPKGTKREINGSFIPETAGKHQVVYALTDFIGTVETVSYDVDVTVSKAPLLNEEATVLPYYIAGYDYKLPTLNGIDYNQEGGAKVEAKISIIDGGEEKKVEGNRFAFTSKENEIRPVTIRYTVSNANASFHKDYETMVLSPNHDGFVHMDRYFAKENMTVLAKDDCLELSATGEAKATFGNPLSAQGLSLNFRFLTGQTSFKAFHVTLRDSLNAEESIRLTYLKEGKMPRVILNGNSDSACDGAALIDGGNQFVNFDAEKGKVAVNTKEQMTVKTFLNGSPFTGFGSKRVYAEFAFEQDAGSQSAFAVTDFNGQEMSSSKYDYIRPQVVLADDYGGARDIGETVNVCAAEAFDVLDPSASISLTVFGPDNKPVTGVDGKLINKVDCDVAHSFVADTYGSYRITYEAKDLDENKVPFTYVIAVNDKIAPSITLNGENQKTAEKGSTLKFASFSANDNLSKEEAILTRIFVFTPNGAMIDASNGSYTFKHAGRHVIRYFAMDEAGNIGLLDQEILVKEAK